MRRSGVRAPSAPLGITKLFVVLFSWYPHERAAQDANVARLDANLELVVGAHHLEVARVELVEGVGRLLLEAREVLAQLERRTGHRLLRDRAHERHLEHES